MSCESTQRAAATLFGAEIAPALGVAPDTAGAMLREIWELTQAQIERRYIPGDTDQTSPARQMRLQAKADDALARERTVACFQALIAMEPPIPLPQHGDPDPAIGFALPKLANQHAWSALWGTVEAVRSGAELPECARQVLAARLHQPAASPPPAAPVALPDLLPSLPPLGVVGFAEHEAISGSDTPLGRAFGSTEVASELLGRVWAAEVRRLWSHTVLGGDVDLEHRALCRALMERLRQAGIALPACPPDTATDMDAFCQRTAYAAVERVLQVVERGEHPAAGMPPRVREQGALPALPPEQQAVLEAARCNADTAYQAARIADCARHLQPGPARDAMIREALDAALRVKPLRSRQHALATVAASMPSVAELDELIGIATSQRAAAARDAVEALVPFLDGAGLARWEQRSPRVRAPKIREALDTAIARERMDRPAANTNLTCGMCGRWMASTATRHACPGPSRVRLRSLAIADQARRAIDGKDGTVRQAVLDDANARLDQIADAIAPDDPIQGLIARDRAWITAPPEHTSP